MINALTIDVEDYFQVRNLSDSIKRKDWENYASRLEDNTYRILDLLNGSLRISPSLPISLNSKPDHQLSEFRNPQSPICNPIRATFFCFGWVAKKYPGLIKDIHAHGHEIACHGYTHYLIYLLSEEEFRKDIRKAKTVLEDLIGAEVIGYRAPCFSITDRSLWALRVIAEEGFQYDSSIFPIGHAAYGLPNAPRFPFLISMNGDSHVRFSMLNFGPEITLDSSPRTPKSEIRNRKSTIHTPQSLLEFPLSTIQIAGSNLPVSDIGCFRRFIYFIFKKRLKGINEVEGRPFILSLHPWELDIEHNGIKQERFKPKIQEHSNVHKKVQKFNHLLKEYDFLPLREMMGSTPSHQSKSSS